MRWEDRYEHRSGAPGPRYAWGHGVPGAGNDESVSASTAAGKHVVTPNAVANAEPKKDRLSSRHYSTVISRYCVKSGPGSRGQLMGA